VTGETPPPGRTVGTSMTVPAVEPAAGPWAPLDLGNLLRQVLAPVAPRNGPVVPAVDGRGASATDHRPGPRTAATEPSRCPGGTDLLVVEGVGAGRRELSEFLDVVVWVQPDFVQAERRGIARDTASGVNGNEEGTIAFWHRWMDEELRFLAADRPWERTDVVVAGTPVIPLRSHEVAVSVPGRAGTATGPPPTPTT
jgi:hypothetical protein